MSNTGSAPKGTAPMAAIHDPNKPTIPVKRLVFATPTDLPEKPASDNVPCARRSDVLDAEGKRINRQRLYLVEYLPWLRHHRVTFYPPPPGQPVERMIPEAQVRSWDPA